MTSLKECCIDLPRNIAAGTEHDSIEEAREALMRNLFDRDNLNLFLMTPFGKTLFEGIEQDALTYDKGITRVSQFIAESGNYARAVAVAKAEKNKPY